MILAFTKMDGGKININAAHVVTVEAVTTPEGQPDAQRIALSDGRSIDVRDDDDVVESLNRSIITANNGLDAHR